MLHRAEQARVLVVSLRGPVRQISRCLIYEFEDAIRSFDAADMVGPNRTLAPGRARYWLRRLRRRVVGERQPPAAGSIPLSVTGRSYDLIFMPIENIEDLFLFGDLDPLFASARRRVCWLVEFWANRIPRHAGALDLLRRFDAVAVGCEGSVKPLQAALGKPCFYLPPAVDALRAWPGERPPARSIDVYSMGRRSPSTHAALLRLAAERDWFYVYDTFRGNAVLEPAEHRLLLTNTIKRARFFLANKAKVDVPEQTGGQEEVGFRFFEGAAGGAVMLGEKPRSEAFESLFPWPDVVLGLPYGSGAVAEVIDEVSRSPERVAAIRAHNVAGALTRHDWLHRWRQILAVVDLAGSHGMQEREHRLQVAAARSRAVLLTKVTSLPG